MGNSARRDAVTMAAEEKRAAAIALRIKGLTFQQIADQLGICSKGYVHTLVREGMEELRQETVEKADELRLIIDARLEQLYVGLVNAGAVDGDPQLANAARKVLDQKAKLWGANAPQKHEHAGPNGGAISVDLSRMSDDELAKLASGAVIDVVASRGSGDGETAAGEDREAGELHPVANAEVGDPDPSSSNP